MILLIIVVLYLLAIMPNLKRKDKMSSFEKVYITHRGLFNNKDIPENSIEAFKGTVKNNYGTELDVQLTKDDKLVVFHDASLKRMCGIDKKLTDCTYEELMNYNLLDTNIKIPLFEEVLKVLKKDTPLIIEIKPEGRFVETTDRVVSLMKSLDYNYTMESFNPLVVKHLKEKYPDIIRGQLAYNMFNNKDCKDNFFTKFIASNYLMNFITKPDYCAYDIKSNCLSFKIISRIYKGECVAWTIKSEKDLKYAKRFYQQYIFDSFIPKN